MTEHPLADAVLPLIRTRADLHRWGPSNEHGRQMHEAVDHLESAASSEDPAVLLDVTQRAIASAMRVILRADDSSGVIGDACRRLLELHPRFAAEAAPDPARLVDWMIAFQFEGEVDYFTLDVVAYAPALGAPGLSAYRARLNALDAGTPQRHGDAPTHERFTLEHNARRLAVLDRDHDAIVRTHARDRRVAAWLLQTSEAFEEIGEVDLAVEWAEQATRFDHRHQARTASRTWCRLLAEHRPDDVLAARRFLFDRWPAADTAAELRAAAGAGWPALQDEVMAALGRSPRDAVLFALLALEDVDLAWSLAHSLPLLDLDAWVPLARAYEARDPLATLPVHTRLVEDDLQQADAKRYRSAATRLAHMRKLALGTGQLAVVDALVADVRVQHRRRPRLLQELDRAKLP